MMSKSLPAIEVESNYSNVLENIHKSASFTGRDGSDISLVGVTKRIAFDRIKPALDAGLKIIGEIISTELKKKLLRIKEYSPSSKIHVVGQMQSNKVKYSVEHCNLIQSVQSSKILSLIDKYAQKLDLIYPILLQVDFSQVEKRKGLNQQEVIKYLEEIKKLNHIEVQGIMTIAPLEYELEEVSLSKFFERTNSIFQKEIKPRISVDSPVISMGMSSDYEIAIKHGSNMVRVGTAIFGSRI